jgi:hypothetical protein
MESALFLAVPHFFAVNRITLPKNALETMALCLAWCEPVQQAHVSNSN